MHPAHLDALLSVLGRSEFPRPNWLRVYRHLHGVARGGVVPCSMNALLLEAPGRPALTGLTDKTLDKVLWALRNLQLLALDVVPSPTSKMPERIWRITSLPELNSRELVFALERVIDKPARLRRTFCRNLEFSEPQADWSDVAPFFAGERLFLDDLVAAAFRKQMSLALKPVATLATELKTGGQGHLAEGGVATGLGGGHRDPGSTWPPVSVSQTGRLVRGSLSTGGSAGDGLGSLGLAESEGGGPMPSDKVRKLLDTVPSLRTAADLEKDGKPTRRPERKRKTVTGRAQNLRQWEHWRSVKPLMDRIYGPNWVAFENESHPPAESTLSEASELCAGIDPAASNPDAIKVIEVLMKGHHDLLKQRIAPTEIPALLLKAWIGYAHLFNRAYAGPGDQNIIPHLRLVLRRLCAKQTRLQRVEILQRMAGFAFRMDGIRRNRKTQYYPKQEWVDIYGHDPKYVTGWQDALLSDRTIKDPLSYMLGLEPFVKPTDDEGRAILPPEPTPAERLAALRKELAERLPFVRSRYVLGEDAWDKLPERDRMDRAIGLAAYDEMKRLEKELEGDPPVQAVP